MGQDLVIEVPLNRVGPIGILHVVWQRNVLENAIAGLGHVLCSVFFDAVFKDAHESRVSRHRVPSKEVEKIHVALALCGREAPQERKEGYKVLGRSRIWQYALEGPCVIAANGINAHRALGVHDGHG